MSMGPAFGVLTTALAAVRVAAIATLPALIPFLIPIAAITTAVGALYLAWKHWDKITAIVQNLYNGVKTWVMDKLGAIWDWAMGKIKAVGDTFAWLYDVVVGHSYIPDMVDEIGQHMARLSSTMVAPAKKMTAEAAQAFEDLRSNVSGIMERLFPQEALSNRFVGEMASLDAAVSKLGLSAEAAIEARRRLRKEYDQGSDIPMIGGVANASDLLPDLKEVDASEIYPQFKKLENAGISVAVTLKQSFADMADDVLSSIDRLAQGIKGGGFLDILSGITGLFTSLGQTGLFGEKIATSLSSSGSGFGGFRAAGGPVSGSKAYVVGEKGPELFMPGMSGFVMPNMGGPGKYAMPNRETPSIYRWAESINSGEMNGGGNRNVTINVNAKDAVLTHTVRGWVQEGMAVAMTGGAQIGSADAQQSLQRKAQRRIP